MTLRRAVTAFVVTMHVFQSNMDVRCTIQRMHQSVLWNYAASTTMHFRQIRRSIFRSMRVSSMMSGIAGVDVRMILLQRRRG